MTSISEQMKYFIQNSPNVHIKEEDFHGEKLYVVKYSRKVFYKNLWNKELKMLRGVVLDSNYNIVSNPFLKVFNYGERQTSIPGENRVLAVQKINGFMASATYHRGKLLVSTTGTISSDFAKMAYKWILPHDSAMKEVCNHLGKVPTFVFEICDPSDPHIVEENPGVYLLGIREKSWDAPMNMVSQGDLDLIAETMQMMRPYWRTYSSFSQVLEDVKTCQHEGYMVYDIENDIPTAHYFDNAEPVNQTLKLKSPFYLVIKFLGRLGKNNLEDLMSDPESFKQKIDEEFYCIVDYIYKNKETFLSKNSEERIEYIREFFIGKINENKEF